MPFEHSADEEQTKIILDASRIINVPVKKAIMGSPGHTVWRRIFAAHFGCDQETLLELWEMVRNEAIDSGFRRNQFLWAMFYLKTYPTDDNAAGRFKVSATTWRMKVHSMWDNWECKQPSSYVDGVDYLVQEERPLNKGLYSHKCGHCLGSSKIVYICGGVECGTWPDLKMADESIAADRGYRGETKIMIK
ncbi:hypothetical protein BC829DRAFT_420242 [Chytridium lagenaria]|nr:hypothetical protein BC829DRAFT_420242 [Chytridium lagenaria]